MLRNALEEVATSSLQESTIEKLLTNLIYVLDRLEFGLMTDNRKQLMVSLANSGGLGVVSSVTAVTTMATLTNQARIGDMQAQRVVEAQLDTAYTLGILNNVTF